MEGIIGNDEVGEIDGPFRQIQGDLSESVTHEAIICGSYGHPDSISGSDSRQDQDSDWMRLHCPCRGKLTNFLGDDCCHKMTMLVMEGSVGEERSISLSYYYAQKDTLR